MSDMSTQGHNTCVKNPTLKLTIDNLIKLILSSHHEDIAAAKACKLPPTGTVPPTFQSVQVSGRYFFFFIYTATSSSITTAAPPPLSIDVNAGQTSSLAPPAKHLFKATMADEDEFNESSDSEPAPGPGKGKKRRKKKSTHMSGGT